MRVLSGARRRPPVPAVLLAVSLLPAALGAQAAGMESAPAAAGPEWLDRWSPLRPLADAMRTFPGNAVAFPGVLINPAPRVGLLWTAGNPAGLPFHVRDSWATFEAALAGAAGAYRRPLDPGDVESRGLSAAGWRRTGERGAVIGRVSADRVTLGGGAHMNELDPYSATPFVIIDTTGADLGRTTAVVEGAGGIRLGPVGLGLALGFTPAETRTVAAPVPKVNISARPAVNAGVVWDVGAALRLGAHGRWQRTTQRIQHFAVAAGSRIYEFIGFHEPIPLDLATHYGQRLEAEALGGGLSAEGEAFGGTWVVHAEAGQVEEVQWDGSRRIELRDRWNATRWEAGLALQRGLRYEAAALLVTGRVLWSTLDGTAYQVEREADVFEAEADALRLDADIRLAHPSGWQGAFTVGTTRSIHIRRDAIARVRAEIRSWSPTAAVEVARNLGSGLSAALGAAAAQYAPAGALPDPTTMESAARTYVAPEHMLYGSPATMYAGEATLRWTRSSGSAVWARARYGSARRVPSAVELPLAPQGTRTGWRLSLGVALPGSGTR